MKHLMRLLIVSLFVLLSLNGADVPALAQVPVFPESEQTYTLPPPPVPTLIAPVNGYTTLNSRVQFDWTSSGNADEIEYQLMFSNSNSIESFLTSVFGIQGREIDFNDHFALNGFGDELHHTFYWRVRARVYDFSEIPGITGPKSDWSAWSEPRQLTVYKPDFLNLPDTTVLPAKITTSDILFEWTAVPGATGYEIHFSCFNVHIYYEPCTTKYFVTSPSYLYTGREISTFYVRVRAINGSILGRLSNTEWILHEPETAPKLTQPVDLLTTDISPMEFTWGEIPNASYYQIQIGSDSKFTTLVYDGIANTPNHIVTVSYGQYYWRVRAHIAGENHGWSRKRQFSYLPSNIDPLAEGVTSFVSLNEDGVLANNSSSAIGLSADGRYVLISSSASNLGITDYIGNYLYHLYVYDRQTGTHTPIDINSEGEPSNRGIYNHAIISGNGRYVLFNSQATNLSPTLVSWGVSPYIRDLYTQQTTAFPVGMYNGVNYTESEVVAVSQDAQWILLATSYRVDTDNYYFEYDTFLYNRQTGEHTLLEGNPDFWYFGMDISDDGNWVVIIHYPGKKDEFSCYTSTCYLTLYNRQTQQTSPIIYNGDPLRVLKAKISGDGRFVVFSDKGWNNYSAPQVKIYEIATGIITTISANSSGILGDSPSYITDISYSGRFITFTSYATNLVENDTNNLPDVFVYDRELGTLERVSLGLGLTQIASGSSGGFISDDGNYVAFTTAGFSTFANPSNNIEQAVIHNRISRQMPVDAPQLISPAPFSATALSNRLFSWQLVNNARQYQIQIATDNAFQTVLYDEYTAFNHHTIFINQPDGDYFWRVRAKNVLGEGPWSGGSGFRLDTSANIVMSEQELFTVAQTKLTSDIVTVIFDVTPDGIITTTQFTNGAVVTCIMRLSIDNGLIRFMLDDIVGGDESLVSILNQELPQIFMNTLSDRLITSQYLVEDIELTQDSIQVAILALP